MFVHFPKALGARGLEKTTDIRPVVRDGSGSPQWWGARRRKQDTVRKYFIDSTDIVAAATTPGYGVENRLQLNQCSERSQEHEWSG